MEADVSDDRTYTDEQGLAAISALVDDVPGCEIDSDDEDLDVSTLGGDEEDDLGHVWVSDAELGASGPHGRRGGVGVTYTEVCCRCGLARTTDTHVPFGGRQGYTRKRYEESPDGLSLRDRLDQYVTDHAGAIHTRHFRGATDVRVYVTRWGWFGVSEADEATWWYLDADQAAETAQEWAGGGR